MRSNEVAHELAQPGARALLESAPMARLAYNGHDGFPRVLPIGFFWDGTAIVMCTAHTSPKVRALEDRPEVAVTIDLGNTAADARALLVRGVVELDTVDGIPREYIAASSKVLSPTEAAEFELQVQGMYERMVRIRVVPTWARFFDFGAGRLPRFLQELADNR